MDLCSVFRYFAERHPFWAFVVSRLIICACGFGIVVLAVLIVFLFLCPFVWPEGGASGFLCWMLIPVVATVIWLLGFAINLILDEVYLW